MPRLGRGWSRGFDFEIGWEMTNTIEAVENGEIKVMEDLTPVIGMEKLTKSRESGVV